MTCPLAKYACTQEQQCVVGMVCRQADDRIALQAASNGGIDPGIIVPAQTGELSPAPAPSPIIPIQPVKPVNPFNLGDLIKNILNKPQQNESGVFHLFQAKSADGKDEQGNDLPGNREKNQGRVGRL